MLAAAIPVGAAALAWMFRGSSAAAASACSALCQRATKVARATSPSWEELSPADATATTGWIELYNGWASLEARLGDESAAEARRRVDAEIRDAAPTQVDPPL